MMGIEFQAALVHRDDLLRQATERHRLIEEGHPPDRLPTARGSTRLKARLRRASAPGRNGIPNAAIGESQR